MDKTILFGRDIAHQWSYRVRAEFHCRHSPGFEQLIQQHVTSSLEDSQFKNRPWRKLGRERLIDLKIRLVFYNGKGIGIRRTPVAAFRDVNNERPPPSENCPSGLRSIGFMQRVCYLERQRPRPLLAPLR